jgi:hypothetical protein
MADATIQLEPDIRPSITHSAYSADHAMMTDQDPDDPDRPKLDKIPEWVTSRLGLSFREEASRLLALQPTSGSSYSKPVEWKVVDSSTGAQSVLGRRARKDRRQCVGGNGPCVGEARSKNRVLPDSPVDRMYSDHPTAGERISIIQTL